MPLGAKTLSALVDISWLWLVLANIRHCFLDSGLLNQTEEGCGL